MIHLVFQKNPNTRNKLAWSIVHVCSLDCWEKICRFAGLPTIMDLWGLGLNLDPTCRSCCRSRQINPNHGFQRHHCMELTSPCVVPLTTETHHALRPRCNFTLQFKYCASKAAWLRQPILDEFPPCWGSHSRPKHEKTFTCQIGWFLLKLFRNYTIK